MYFVNRENIHQTTGYISKLILLFKEKQQWTELLDHLALERLSQNIAVVIIDTGKQLIDGFIMRDPGSYEDIIDILVDERVVPPSDEEGLKEVVKLRKNLVNEYTKIDQTLVLATLEKYQENIASFPEKVRKYLEQELGPVSAFSPEGQEPK
jgi:uncharacterized protein YutE (UPF0331/DUF86 family)